MNQIMSINTNQGLTIRNPNDNYYYNTISFLEYLNGQPVTEDSIRSYFKHLDSEYRAGRYKAKTVLIKRAAVKHRVRAIFDSLDYENNQRLKFVLNKIDKEIKPPKVGKGSISKNKTVNEDEYDLLIDACNSTRQQLYIDFLMKTALRINELINIKLSDIKPGSRMSDITIRGKGGKERNLRVETALINDVMRVFQGKEYLFETEKNRKCNKNYISGIIKKIGCRIDKDISAHVLRHSWATIAYQKHPDKIQALSLDMGHSDVKTFLSFYVHNELTDNDRISIIRSKRAMA